MPSLQSITFRGKRGTDPVIFSRTRHFAFSDPQGSMRIDGAPLGRHGVKLFAVRSTGHEVAVCEETHVNVIVPLRGAIHVATATADVSARDGELLVFGPNERRTVVVPDRAGLYEALLLAVPRDRLADTADAAATVGCPDLGKLPPGGDTALLGTELSGLMALLRRGSVPGETLAMTAEDLADRLAACLARGTASRGAAGSMAQLRRAEAFMAAHAGAPLRIADVAADAGLSVRGLQATFRRHRGLTPHQALTRARLEETRLRLLQGFPGDRVTDIALQCGFTHLGRFSQSYADRFGESPSATLRRAQSG